MAYILKLGTFAKKRNSTAQPDMTGWAEYAVTLKNGSDLVNPSVYLHIPEAEAVNYNYAYMLGSYYYIVQKSMDRKDLCTMQLQKDVLASYKNEIGNSNLYILRSSATYDGSIPDNHYPPTAQSDVSVSFQDIESVPYVDFNTGYYLVSVMGIGNAAGGAEMIFQLSPASFKIMIMNLFTQIGQFTVNDAWNQIAQFFGGNPQELISGVVWVPWGFPGVDNVDVIIGRYNTDVKGRLVTKSVVDLAEYTHPIPKHPQAADRGEYLNLSPYTYHTLSLNCGGIIELDTTKLVNVDQIRVKRTLNTKGELLTQVFTDAATGSGSYLLAKIFGQMGVPISLNGNNAGSSIVTGVVGTVSAAATAIATGGAGAAASLIGAGLGTVTSAICGASSNSSSGSVVGLGEQGRLTSIFYYVIDEDRLNNGRPYCKQSTPAALGGYMTAYKAPISISATLPEVDEIQNYLASGFYYE